MAGRFGLAVKNFVGFQQFEERFKQIVTLMKIISQLFTFDGHIVSVQSYRFHLSVQHAESLFRFSVFYRIYPNQAFISFKIGIRLAIFSSLFVAHR